MKLFGYSFGRMQYIGLGLVFFAFLLTTVVMYINSEKRFVPIIFSQKEILINTWLQYKDEYLEPGTLRTLDKQQNNITTSEGQSYAMLRAVWMDDKATFDAVFRWTQDNLKHTQDNLHAWLFGESSSGKYQVLTEKGGENSATDAETDIALSLIFAYVKWDDPTYLTEATRLIDDIWTNSVVMIQDKPVLVANDLERYSSDTVLVNPSYLSPYAYRIFSMVDPSHDWQGLVDNSYIILKESSSMNLDKSSSANIPPDWIEIDRRDGSIHAAQEPTLTTNYSYDALRLPWRVALDWEWYKDSRAKELLDSYSFFTSQWENSQKIATTYSHDGTPLVNEEAPAIYGGLIGYFMVSDQKNAEEVYRTKLQLLYNPDTNSWRTKLGYYDANWVWFGIGLYEHLLPNFAELLPKK